MARVRKRDWPQLVYKYYVRPDSIPDQLWVQAKKMQALWNALAIEHEYVRMSIDGKTTEDERKEKWEMFNREAAYLNRNAGLNWESDVLDNFTKACVAAAKQPERGWPKPRGLTVSIPHRFTGGGSPVQTLWGNRSKRIRFDRPISYENSGRYSQDRRRIDGVFGLDDDATVFFRETVHRPIPPSAIVKSARLVGRRSVAFGWEWSIAITVELPPDEPRTPTGKRCAIDVGWRKREKALRVGYMVDSDGNSKEILLPLDFSNKQSRSQKQRYPLFLQIPENHDDLRVLACERDLKLEECKSKLKRMLYPVPAGFDRMRARGLVKILHEIEDNDAAKKLIEDWLEWDRPRFRRETRARNRFAARRADIYSNIAAELARQYDEIVVEQLNIANMISDDDRDESLKAANTYHQIAATGDFISILGRACRKYWSILTKKTAVDSTIVCHVCGQEKPSGPELVQTCRNGHSHDQDHCAAANLLKETWGREETKPAKRRAREKAI